MTFEEKLEELENKKRVLQLSFLNNEPINIETVNIDGEKVINTYNPNEEEYLSNYEKEIKSLNKQISILKLNNDHENKRPLIYHFIDSDNSEEDIELGANDADYEKAYNQQLDFIENGIQTTEKFMEEIHNNQHTEKELDAIMDEIHAKNTTKEEKQENPNEKQIDSSKEKHEINKPYAVFKVGNNIQIIGDLSLDDIKNIDSELINKNKKNSNKYISKNMEPREHTYSNFPGVKVNIDSNGYIEIEGAEETEYHNRPTKIISDTKDTKENTEDIQVISQNDIVPSSAKHVKGRKENKKLLQKLKKHLPKILIGAAVIGVIGVATFAAYQSVPEFAQFINNIIPNLSAHPSVDSSGSLSNISDGINNLVKQASQLANSSAIPSNMNGPIPEITSNIGTVSSNTSSTLGSIDWGNVGQGDTVFRSAYDAVLGNGGLQANEWFVGNPLDVFNTTTNEFMHLTQEQLSNPEFLQTLANDPNNAILFGNSMQDPSGFMSLTDALGEVAKGGIHI